MPAPPVYQDPNKVAAPAVPLPETYYQHHPADQYATAATSMGGHNSNLLQRALAKPAAVHLATGEETGWNGHGATRWAAPTYRDPYAPNRCDGGGHSDQYKAQRLLRYNVAHSLNSAATLTAPLNPTGRPRPRRPQPTSRRCRKPPGQPLPSAVPKTARTWNTASSALPRHRIRPVAAAHRPPSTTRLTRTSILGATRRQATASRFRGG